MGSNLANENIVVLLAEFSQPRLHAWLVISVHSEQSLMSELVLPLMRNSQHENCFQKQHNRKGITLSTLPATRQAWYGVVVIVDPGCNGKSLIPMHMEFRSKLRSFSSRKVWKLARPAQPFLSCGSNITFGSMRKSYPGTF